MNRRRKGRECALQILFQLDLSGNALADSTFALFWEDRSEPEDVRAFAEGLVRGTAERLVEIDRILGTVAARWELRRMAAVDRNLLRLAAFEILYRPDIPPTVTINEAVEIAKKYSTPDSPSFVNGILDRLMHDPAVSGQDDE